MKRYTASIGLFLILLLLSSCRERPDETGYGTYSGKTGPSGDSLKQLDSLVLAARMSKRDLARKYATEAYRISIRSGNGISIVRSGYLLALTTAAEDKDSSFYFLDRALRLARQINDHSETSNILFSLSLLYEESGDHRSALQCLDSAMMFAEKYSQYSNISRIFNSFGNIYIELNDSVSSEKYYQKAYDIACRNADFTVMGLATGNLAQFLTDPAEVNVALKRAITLLRKSEGNESEISQLLVNSALAEPDPTHALELFSEALTLARNANLEIVQLGVLNNMVYSLLDTGNPDSALSCVKNYAIPIAVKLDSHDWLATLYDTYADVLLARGDFRQAATNLKYAIAERTLDDQQKSRVQIRLLAAIMDTKNREAALEKSSLDLEHHKNIVKIQYLSGLALLFASALIIFFLLWRIQRKKLIQKEREAALSKRINHLEEHQTVMLGRELHDIVSSLMQQLAGQVTASGADGDSGILLRDRMGTLLTSIRNISHRMNKLDFSKGDLMELLLELKFDLVNLTGIDLEMEINGNLPPFNEEMSRNIYRIIQEMLTNAGKYAGRSQVSVSLGVANNKVVIAYQDHGPGFDPLTLSSDGIGIAGIRDRISFLGGTENMETSPGNGLSWIISIPVSTQTIK